MRVQEKPCESDEGFMSTDFLVYTLRIVSALFSLGISIFAVKAIIKRWRKRSIFFDVMAFFSGLLLAVSFLIGATVWGPSLDVDPQLALAIRAGVMLMLFSMFGLYHRRANES